MSAKRTLRHRQRAIAVPAVSVRAPQRMRLVLSPDEHSRHQALLDRAYCATSGWTNPTLDAAIGRVRFRDRRS